VSYVLLDQRQSKARKPHRCTWCGQTIEPGEVYHFASGICDGDFQRDKMHLVCRQAMDRDMQTCDWFDYEFIPFGNPRGMTQTERDDQQRAAKL